jgi:predicted Zn-dependent peptidase
MAVDPARAVESTALALRELNKLCDTPVAATELNGAIEYTKGSLLLASESNENQMVRCAQNEINFQRDIKLQEVIERIESVSAEDILALSQSLFARKKMVLTLLGPIKDEKPFKEMLYA